MKTLTILLTLSALTLFCAPPPPQLKKLPPDKFSKFVNQYVYDGNYIICIKDSAKLNDPNGCNHFNEIGFDVTLPMLRKLYGEEKDILRNNDGSETKIFLLDSSVTPPPYLAVAFRDNRAVMMQLTGKSCSRNVSFSGITLGSKSSRVIETLGPPSRKKKVQEIHGELWDYAPFRFSFEIVNNSVFSIQLVTEAE
jgi:hypothetical protein